MTWVTKPTFLAYGLVSLMGNVLVKNYHIPTVCKWYRKRENNKVAALHWKLPDITTFQFGEINLLYKDHFHQSS